MGKDFEIKIVYNHFPQLAAKAHDAVKEIVRVAAKSVQENSQVVLYKGHGVDTGELKSSIDVKMEGDLLAIIGPHTDYAVYVEFGHHSFPGYGYMTKGAEAVRPTYIGELSKLESRLR